MLSTNIYNEGSCYANSFNGMVKINIILNLSELLISVDRIRLAKEIFDGFSTGHDLNLTLESDIVGSVKLISVIENLYKVALLHKSYVIHQIDPNLCKTLADKQKKEPVSQNEVLAVQPFNIALTKNTVQISRILNNLKYSSLINFDADEIRIIKDINEKRNFLHFITTTENVRSNEINAAYLKLQKKLVQELLILNDKVGTDIPGAAALNRKNLELAFNLN